MCYPQVVIYLFCLYIFNVPPVCILNRNPYGFSDSDSDFDEEEDDKKTKKKKKKKVGRGGGFWCCFRFIPRFFLLLIFETPERQDHNYKAFILLKYFIRPKLYFL